MFILYDVIFLFYSIFYLPYLLLTKRAYAGYGMRFGFFDARVKDQITTRPNIWLHAVSVGEVMVIDGLIRQLREKYPSYQLIVTVTTKTGYELARKRFEGKGIVIPSPLDFSFVTARFVKLINPKIYIGAETEIWPNLFDQLHRSQVPIIIINGRISDKAFSRYKLIRFLLKKILNQVSVWCMQTKEDMDRIIFLGAQASKVINSGNIKFDDIPSNIMDPAIDGILPTQEELWWVAGSTHPGEEDIVLNVYSEIIKDNPRWRLVMAPRHVDRVDDIIELITSRGFKAVKFSQNQTKSLPIDTILVVDTIGHLRSLYARASLVFVGKSLSVGGGHNVIEPAFYGKAIVIGPQVANFRDIVGFFKQSNAIVQVEDALAFAIALKELSSDSLKRELLGNRAKEVIIANQGATQRSLEHIAEFLK